MPMGVEIVEHEVNLPRLGVFSAKGLDEVREDLRRAIRLFREQRLDIGRRIERFDVGGRFAHPDKLNRHV